MNDLLRRIAEIEGWEVVITYKHDNSIVWRTPAGLWNSEIDGWPLPWDVIGPLIEEYALDIEWERANGVWCVCCEKPGPHPKDATRADEHSCARIPDLRTAIIKAIVEAQ